MLNKTKLNKEVNIFLTKEKSLSVIGESYAI